MRNYYHLLTLFIGWLAFAVGMHAQSSGKAVHDVENRLVYGMSGNNENPSGYGMITFRTGSEIEQNTKLLSPWTRDLGIFAGAGANGNYYGFAFMYLSMEGPQPIGLAQINPLTGEIVRYVADWSQFGGFKFMDMTYDYSTSTMYAIGFEYSSYLYTIDLNTGDTLKIGQLQVQGEETAKAATVAATYDGRLYVITLDGKLYQVDKETAVMTFVFDTGKDLTYLQSMEFDHTDESLYWASDESTTDEQINNLHKIDIEKKTCTFIGKLRSETHALYIPFVKQGFSVPGPILDLEAIPADQGKEEMKLVWTNPVKTHGEDEMTGSLNLVVERDGEAIASLFGEAGEEMEYVDKEVVKGEHMYTIKVKNNIGEGLVNNIETYVGPDVPARVTDLKQTIGENCKSIKLSWTVPTVGQHGGFYENESVTFKIVRYPDNELIHESFKGTSYEDKTMTRLAPYYYIITPSNEAGKGKEYVAPTVVIAGNAKQLPFECDFSEEGIVKSEWSIVDVDDDTYTWYLNSTAASQIWGDENSTYAADFVPIDGPHIAPDEWLISPPLTFEAGKDYHLSFDTRSAGVDELDITIGKLNAPESQTQFIAQGLFTEDASESQKFQHHVFSLPKVEGVHCVGFHLHTAAYQSGLFQITNIAVNEGTSIESNKVQKTAVRANNGTLKIEGEFCNAEVYDATGSMVASLHNGNAQVATTGWHTGIYIVKVADADSVYTKKVVIK